MAGGADRVCQPVECSVVLRFLDFIEFLPQVGDNVGWARCGRVNVYSFGKCFVLERLQELDVSW